MRGFYVVSALALILSGCVSASPEQSIPIKKTVPHSITREERAIIEEGVKKRLKDPNSAMFGTMVASQDGSDASWVCGSVNAKNSFGGYTGSKLFMGMLTHMRAGDKVLRTFSVTGMGGTDSETYAVLTMCERYGVMKINQ